jgi:hypothetical protein
MKISLQNGVTSESWRISSGENERQQYGISEESVANTREA